MAPAAASLRLGITPSCRSPRGRRKSPRPSRSTGGDPGRRNGFGKDDANPKMCLAAGRGETRPDRVHAAAPRGRAVRFPPRGGGTGGGLGPRGGLQDPVQRPDDAPRPGIKFLTDGMLLAEVQGDPLLREYDTIIIDEAHERSLNIDFLLGHLRQLRARRPELKIIITSATIDTEAFSKAFDDAPVIKVEGRTYPVEVIYAPLDSLRLRRRPGVGDAGCEKAEALHYIDGAVEAVERIAARTARRATSWCSCRASGTSGRRANCWRAGRRGECEIVPLVRAAVNAEQQRVFAPSAAPEDRHRDQHRGDLADDSRHPLRRRHRSGAAQPLLAAGPHAAAADRADRPVERRPAQGPLRPRGGRRVHPAVFGRGLSRRGRVSRSRKSSAPIWPTSSCGMKAFGFGDIERFPFINLPAPKAIRAGYALLRGTGRRSTRGRRR